MVAVVCVSTVVIHNVSQGMTFTAKIDTNTAHTRLIQYTDFNKNLSTGRSNLNSTEHNPAHFSTVSGNTSETLRTLHAPKQEVRHIGFLKVHKAASSTMQNIYFRFGMKRNLTFVFTEHPNYFSREVSKPIPVVKPRYRKGHDILCNHGVFNYDVYSSFLPKDSVYLAIVRDPMDLFISAVNYYSQKEQLLAYLGKVPGNRLKNLIQFPDKYDKGLFSYTKNVMARDFGFPMSLKPENILSKITELDSIFKLVLVVEYFEESLILMKRYLNWKFQDILFISNNVYSRTGWSLTDLAPEDITKFTYRNQLDVQVYNYFYEKFWKQFRSEPDDIHVEVLCFKEVLKKLSTFCHIARVATSDVLIIEKTEWNDRFVVLASDCEYMRMDELKFINKLRALQGSELGRRNRVKRVLRRH